MVTCLERTEGIKFYSIGKPIGRTPQKNLPALKQGTVGKMNSMCVDIDSQKDTNETCLFLLC